MQKKKEIEDLDDGKTSVENSDIDLVENSTTMKERSTLLNKETTPKAAKELIVQERKIDLTLRSESKPQQLRSKIITNKKVIKANGKENYELETPQTKKETYLEQKPQLGQKNKVNMANYNSPPKT